VPTKVNIGEAKTNFSSLIARAQKGEEIIIANRGKPVIRFEAILESKKRKLGFVKGELPNSFFDELPEEELVLWEGK
jgi:antitoxin (DNA-binding transcriptional repressor) of toxin-antitoxin stability system